MTHRRVSWRPPRIGGGSGMGPARRIVEFDAQLREQRTVPLTDWTVTCLVATDGSGPAQVYAGTQQGQILRISVPDSESQALQVTPLTTAHAGPVRALTPVSGSPSGAPIAIASGGDDHEVMPLECDWGACRIVHGTRASDRVDRLG